MIPPPLPFLLSFPPRASRGVLSSCVLLVERSGGDVLLDVAGYVRSDTVEDVRAVSVETGRSVELSDAEHDRACRKLSEVAS